jgi:hypothetical protein
MAEGVLVEVHNRHVLATDGLALLITDWQAACLGVGCGHVSILDGVVRLRSLSPCTAYRCGPR